MRVTAIRRAALGAAPTRVGLVSTRPIPRLVSPNAGTSAHPTRPLGANSRLGVDSRRYASSGASTGGNGVVWLALGTLAVVAVLTLKPKSVEKAGAGAEKAAKAAEAGDKKASAAATQAAKDAEKSYSTTVGDIAVAVLPESVLAFYDQVEREAGATIGGFLTKVKDTDIQGTLDSLKNSGSDEVKNVVEQVQAKLQQAGGKVQNVDWKQLSADLSKEYGEKSQQAIDVLIGKLPTSADFDEYFQKAEQYSKDQLKELDEAADKLYKQVEKAAKDKKAEGDAWVRGVIASRDEDVDKLVTDLKKLSKEIGVAPETIEQWLRDRSEEGKLETEKFARDFQARLDQAAKWFPADTDELVARVSAVSPAVGKLFDQLIKESNASIERGKAEIAKAKKDASDKANTAKAGLKSAKDAVDSTVKSAKDTASAAAQNAKDTADAAIKNVKDTVGGAAQNAKDSADAAAKSAQNAADDAAAWAKDQAAQAQNAAGDAAAWAKDQAAQAQTAFEKRKQQAQADIAKGTAQAQADYEKAKAQAQADYEKGKQQVGAAIEKGKAKFDEAVGAK